jgi:hypothetical protein
MIALFAPIGLAPIEFTAGDHRPFKRKVLKRMERVVVDEYGNRTLGGQPVHGPLDRLRYPVNVA